MKILKAVFFNLMVLCSISFVSADAHYDSSIGIIINGSGNNLSSIETNIGNPVVFSYINTTGTAMVNTNIFVDENSELILNNQTLVFNCSYVGECRLETNSNGTHEMGGNSTLMVVNRSRLTVSNPGYEFYMVVRNNSAFTLRDSELTECGFNISHPGLNITAKYANITDNVIYDVYYGIYLNHADYCSISGNNISSEKDGIQLNYADYCSISGNNISSESYKGIYLENSDYCSISGNNVSAYNEGIHMQYSDYCDILMNRISSVQSGIYLYSSDNNNISNSMVFSSDFRGFYLVSSNYCNISENNISSDDEGIYLSSSNNNTLSDSQVVSSNSHGVYLINSDYVTLISSHLLGTVKDLKLESSSENLRLINTTYSSSEIVDSSSYLRRFWYLDVYVKDSAGNPIHGVNVTGWMLNGTQAFTTLTASTGYIARQTVEQYYQNYTNISYYTPHMVNVSKGDYLPENKNFSLSVSKFLLFELNTPPNVTLISVDGESSDNFTTNNKTPEIKFKFLDPEKFYAYCKVVISSLDTATIHVSPSLLAQNDTVMNFTSPALSEGNWTVYVECNDSTDVGMSETRTLYVNKLPEVQLIHPVDNTLNLGGLVDFTYNVSDNESSLDCSFYSNLTGIWDWNGSQSITPPSLSFFTRNLTDGVYVWNVECFDGYQSAFAPNNYTIKVDSNTPDLAISEADVSFSSDAPVEGNLVWVTVTVWNNGIGNVTNVTVEFILDGSSRDNNTISVPGNSSNNTVFSWTAVEGSRSLNFTVDPEEHIEEFDEDNNKVHISKTVAPTTTLPPSTDGGDPGGGINLPKPLPSCFDGIQNCHDGDCEEGVDCGGPCKSCMSCSDGIQNQGEEGVDCGGPCPSCDETITPSTLPPNPTTTLAGGAKPGVETEAVTSTDLRGSDMVNIAVPLRNVTSTSTTSTSTSTTTPDSDDIGFVEMSQRYVGSAQKQIFEFMSGVYNMVSDNPMESTVSVLLLLGMFYVYYSRVRSSGLGKETDNVKDEVDGKKK